jgi:hypothetical protein
MDFLQYQQKPQTTTDHHIVKTKIKKGLEHLIFLGSEDYPYKGFLDRVANRCFAQGTNAW